MRFLDLSGSRRLTFSPPLTPRIVWDVGVGTEFAGLVQDFCFDVGHRRHIVRYRRHAAQGACSADSNISDELLDIRLVRTLHIRFAV